MILQPGRTFSLVLLGVAAVGLEVACGHSGDDSTQQVTLVAPRDGATITTARAEFRWLRNARATTYYFFLYEVNRTPVWSALIRDTSLAVPHSVELQRGQTYLWRVEAILPDETKVRSDLRTFTLSQ